MRSDRRHHGRPWAARRSLLGTGAALAWAAGLAPAFAQTLSRVTVVDDQQRPVPLVLPLKRVVVFNRYTTEFVRAIGAMDAVVGTDIDVSRHGRYWPTVTREMLAGSNGMNPNYEVIAAMRPDAVLMPRNSDWARAATLLAPMGIAVVVVTAWDYLRHEFNVELLGRLFDRPRQADALNRWFRTWRTLLEARIAPVAAADRPRVYFEEVGDWRTVLPGSGWHDMIEAAGGVNVFGDVRLGDPGGSGATTRAAGSARGSVHNFVVDPEEVLARRPDVIVKLQPGQYEPHPREFAREVLDQLARRPALASLPAVRAQRLYHLSYHLAGGCSKITGALQLAQWLHPQRLRGLEPLQAMDEWLEQWQRVPRQRGYAWSMAELRG
jgi:iron complex transport system substrate-binding protein